MSVDALNIKHIPIQALEKNPLCAAFGLGIVTAFSLAPLGLFFAPLVSFPFILSLTYQAKNLRRVILMGFLFAFGYFVCGLYWTSAAFYLLLRDVMWLAPFSVIGLPFSLALFWIPAFVIAYLTRGRPLLSILTFITILTWGEYARANFILNFSWNLLGYGLYRIPQLLQLSSMTGIYGLNFFWIALSCLPLLIYQAKETKYFKPIISMMLVMITTMFTWGHLRLQKVTSENESVAIQIIHPNISQIEKLESPSETNLIQKYIDLTKDRGDIRAPSMLSIWPENTLSLYQNRSETSLEILSKYLPENSYVLVGAERFFPRSRTSSETLNSLVVLNKRGDIIAAYNKHILAPWGESFPYEKILRQKLFLDLLKDKKFLTAGNGATTLNIPNIPPFAPQICYETAYAGYTPQGANRPAFIAVISNDNWADYTTQPDQAFIQTRVRAIEEGLPVLRAANKGISAIIDPYGHALQSLNSDEAGTINGYLPTSIAPTFYARYGDTPFLIFMSGLSIIFLIGFLKHLKK